MNEAIDPGDLMNGVLAKVYDKLTEGDPDVVAKSPDNHFAWLSIPMPFDESDFDFMVEGFKGVPREPVFSPLNTAVSTHNDEKKVASNDDEEPSAETASEEVETPQDQLTKEELIAIDVNRKYLQAENLAALLDYIPDVDGMDVSTINVFSSEGRISSVYNEVLNHCMVSDYEMDDETKEKLEKYKSKLTVKEFDDILEKEIEKPSKMVTLYAEKKNVYDAAVLEYAEARADAITATDESSVHAMAGGKAKVLQSKKDQALRDWVSNGYKEQYEHITNFISHVEGRHMVKLIAQYKKDFENSQITAMSGSQLPFQYTSLVPGSFARTQSWTEFKYTFNDYKKKYHGNSSSFKAGGGGGFLGWGAKASAGHATSNTKKEVDVEGFYLKFKICAVQTYKPWLHQTFLTNTSWKFDSNDVNYKDDLLSDGNIPATGRMPGLTTQCIFVKDLRLHYGKHHSEFESNLKRTKISGKVTSPFGSAGFNSKNHNFDFEKDSDSQTNEIRVNGMQLIGFKYHLLGKSPNPNPEIERWV